MTTAVFLIHLAATLLMTGAIWIVQVVHYPLFSAVGTDAFRACESAHETRITVVVAPANSDRDLVLTIKCLMTQ